jgi:hypothetical protein
MSVPNLLRNGDDSLEEDLDGGGGLGLRLGLRISKDLPSYGVEFNLGGNEDYSPFKRKARSPIPIQRAVTSSQMSKSMGSDIEFKNNVMLGASPIEFVDSMDAESGNDSGSIRLSLGIGMSPGNSGQNTPDSISTTISPAAAAANLNSTKNSKKVSGLSDDIVGDEIVPVERMKTPMVSRGNHARAASSDFMRSPKIMEKRKESDSYLHTYLRNHGESIEITRTSIRVGDLLIQPDGLSEAPRAPLSTRSVTSSTYLSRSSDASESKSVISEVEELESPVFSKSFSMHSPSPGNEITKYRSLDFIPFGSVIGRGNSGTVIKALNVIDFKVYALKSISVQKETNAHQMAKELLALISMKCDQLVSFHGAFFDQGKAIFVLDYMNRGSLQNVLDNSGPIDEECLQRIAKSILLGLKRMHDKRQVHRDIKPANILINRRGQVKISDFGIVKQLEDAKEITQSFVGTKIYMSPERLKSQAYSYPSDIWSFGLTLHTLAAGEFPYKSGAERGFAHLFQTVTSEASPKLPRGKFSKELRNFLSHCLDKDPMERWTAKKLLEHPFVENVDITEPYTWPWDAKNKSGLERDAQDLNEIAQVLGKSIYAKSSYRRTKENITIFSSIAESLGIPLNEAQLALERGLPLKCLAESPFS